MKSLTTLSKLAVIALAFSASSAMAWTSTSPVTKEYSFKYQLKDKTLTIKKTATSYETAFEDAAQQCFNELRGKGRISEDRGLDIIDICANPRS